MRFRPAAALRHAADSRATGTSAAPTARLFDPADPAARVACHFTDESRATAGVIHRQEISLGEPVIGGTLLEVEDLAKDYRVRGVNGSRKGWLRAVESVTFAIRSGESLGLVGESGSGKSTVARLLLGLTPRTRGTVVFEGRGLEASSGGIAKEHRGRVQMVFQDPGDSLNPLMSIEQIVAEPLLLLHRREARTHRGRVPELLELVGLEADYGKRRPLAALGRPAPAGRDREGAGDRPGADRLRRGRCRRSTSRSVPRSSTS